MLDDMLLRQGAAAAARGYSSLEWGGMVVCLGSDKGKCCCCVFRLRLHCNDGKPRHKGRPSDKRGDMAIIGRRKGGYWVAGSSPIAALARHGRDVVTVARR